MEYSSLSLFRTTATYTWLSDLLITRTPAHSAGRIVKFQADDYQPVLKFR